MKNSTALLFIGAFLLHGCTTGNDGDSDSAKSASINALPKVTGGVASSRDYAATTGQVLTSWDSKVFDGTMSGPMCVAGNMVKETISAASIPDKQLCVLGALEYAGTLSGINYLGEPNYV